MLKKDTWTVGGIVFLIGSVIAVSCMLTGPPVEFGGSNIAPVLSK